MNFTEIEDKEYLFRGIHINQWSYEKNRPSSAAFKDKNGLSVDRSCNRDDKQCVEFLNKGDRFFAVCKINAGQVREISAHLAYRPSSKNKYHSEIHDSKDRIKLAGSKTTKLKNLSLIVYKK